MPTKQNATKRTKRATKAAPNKAQARRNVTIEKAQNGYLVVSQDEKYNTKTWVESTKADAEARALSILKSMGN